jgi:hypothetical protein
MTEDPARPTPGPRFDGYRYCATRLPNSQVVSHTVDVANCVSQPRSSSQVSRDRSSSGPIQSASDTSDLAKKVPWLPSGFP